MIFSSPPPPPVEYSSELSSHHIFGETSSLRTSHLDLGSIESMLEIMIQMILKGIAYIIACFVHFLGMIRLNIAYQRGENISLGDLLKGNVTKLGRQIFFFLVLMLVFAIVVRIVSLIFDPGILFSIVGGLIFLCMVWKFWFAFFVLADERVFPNITLSKAIRVGQKITETGFLHFILVMILVMIPV